MNEREVALKIMIDAGLVNQIANADLVIEIADAFVGVIRERNKIKADLEKEKSNLLKEYGKIDDIMQICRGLKPIEWEEI